jgi:Enoyl reductase domain of yeast-type FAS1
MRCRATWCLKVNYEKRWSKEWGPASVCTRQVGFMFSSYTDPPTDSMSLAVMAQLIMVVGVTPTAVKAGFVGAVFEAGYRVELTGVRGGITMWLRPAKIAEVRDKIQQVSESRRSTPSTPTPPLWLDFQFPLLQETRREGLPVEGFRVEKAAEIIQGLKIAHVKHATFKFEPVSVDGIRQCQANCAIAVQ